MPRRPPSRWLAPLAIAAVAAAGYGIVNANRGTSGAGDGKSATTAPRRRGDAGPKGATGAKGPKTYRVRSGDTLSSISLETGVPLERITALNPRLDAQALQPGQRLTLRP